MAETIPDVVQDAVDQYVELYQVFKQLEERVQALRKEIEPFMKDSGIESISDRNRLGKVQMTVQNRAKMTSRYTTYDVHELSKLLSPELVEKCLVEVVDRERVDALTKLGEISSEVAAHRAVTPTYGLTVRFGK
ncbi:DUF7376 domain-containing protein [Alicyclobacillus fastidiosus]|uniref:Uncharacterized protein n=1 Tax=Alicyclobacillus fastidiosus TaxID=392011 RepID=A0ABV5AEF7_9BACL|nr:hypothetical protein [Alicyclobacillus fastidiosus]WEH09773.1 hypothetical protein PYS47_00245 [Alicyclobacillus fastidiosus]